MREKKHSSTLADNCFGNNPYKLCHVEWQIYGLRQDQGCRSDVRTEGDTKVIFLAVSFKKYFTGNHLLIPFMFLSFASLQPAQIPNSSDHLPFLTVCGTTSCMIHWYGWMSIYEALTQWCKLTHHLVTMPVMLVLNLKCEECEVWKYICAILNKFSVFFWRGTTHVFQKLGGGDLHPWAGCFTD